MIVNQKLKRRLATVAVILVALAAVLVYRLVMLYMGYLGASTGYFAETALTQYRYQQTVRPPRGNIYDQGGVLLATNAIEYEIGLSPSLIYAPEEAAEALSGATGIPYEELLASMASDESGALPTYVPLMRPASSSIGQAVLALDLGEGVVIDPLPRRYYPHGTLAAHVLGFANLDNVGSYGVEGYYDDELKGRVSVDDQSRIPFDATDGAAWQPGADLYLTLDSEVQYLAERTLAEALTEYDAQSGTIIVLEPQSGAIIAMANQPTFDPNRYYAQDYSLFINPAVSSNFEPGSTLKALTMALALEEGVVTPDSTYQDNGVLDVAGIEIYNWDRGAYGTVSMTDLLAKSLNVGAATLSIRLGPTNFYDGLAAFNLGSPVGAGLEGEASGTIRRPGDSNWFESDLATNSFGQGLDATPLQMAAAFAAIANDGLLMQPHILSRQVDPDGTVTTFNPVLLSRPISAETADILTEMMAAALERESSEALVPGYRVAGKTGTAQIPIPGGYDPDETIHSFIGFGPVDDPQFVVLVKLDRPQEVEFGSQSAGPVFGEFVSRLVVLMEVPPDSIRRQLAAAGG